MHYSILGLGEPGDMAQVPQQEICPRRLCRRARTPYSNYRRDVNTNAKRLRRAFNSANEVAAGLSFTIDSTSKSKSKSKSTA